jgi:ParB family chromosome partitioning protein
MGKQAIDAPRGEPTFKVDPEGLVIIGLDTEDGPEHVLWDKRAKKATNAALVHDIMAHGILEPVLIYRNGTTIEVVDGRQRVKAARKANELLLERDGAEAVLIKVPCMRRTGDETALFKVMISANAQRENLDQLEEAALMARAVERGMSEEECAVHFGLNKQTVKNRLALNSVTGEVKAAIVEGKIPATAAMKLAPLARDEQKEALAELIESGDTSGEAAARTTRKVKAKKNGHAKEENSHPTPGKRLLRKIIESETASEAIDANALAAIRWILGDVSARAVRGLSTLIASIEAGE